MDGDKVLDDLLLVKCGGKVPLPPAAAQASVCLAPSDLKAGGGAVAA